MSPLNSYSEGLKQLTVFASPIIATSLVQETSIVFTLVFLGRMKNAEFIGGATLGNMMCNITGFSLAFGLCSALDTLISQAFGAKLYRLMGLHTQKAIAILTISSIPVIILWTKTGWILHNLLFIDKVTSELAGLWSSIIAIGLWPSLMFEILRKFLQGQQIVWPVVISSVLATLTNIISNYILIDIYDLGFKGAAYSSALSQWVGFLSLVLIICIRKCLLYLYRNSSQNRPYKMVDQNLNILRNDPEILDSIPNIISSEIDEFAENDPEDNWPHVSLDIFRDWGTFLSLGIPGALSLFFEWGSFELVASIAGQLGSVRLATHGVFMSTCGLFYMTPNAIAAATSTLAGNFLGENSPSNAKFIIKLGIIVDFIWGFTSGLILIYFLRPYWGKIYTDEKDVQKMIYDCLPIMLLYTTVDSTKCITLNILRSTGRPGITVLGNIVTCIFVMLPLGYLLSLHLKLGLTGLWLAMSIAWLLCTIVYLYVIVTTDWQIQADIAEDRNKSSTQQNVQKSKLKNEVDTLNLSRSESGLSNNKNFSEENHDEDEDEDDDDNLIYSFSPIPNSDLEMTNM